MIPQEPFISTAAITEPGRLFHLAAAGELRPLISPEPALPARVSGMPAFYYWKDAIVVGSYVHPVRRFSLDVTRDRLDGYVVNFNRMRTNGIAVPILMDHAPTASATLGWIVDVKRDGDRLMELHQFLGETARDIGLRNKVSLGIDPRFVDGKGINYGEAIVHSAVTPVPVVPNQGEFEPVTLSDNNEVLIELSLAENPAADIHPRLHEDIAPPVIEAADVHPRLREDIAPPVLEAADVYPRPVLINAKSSPELHLAMHALEQAAAVKRDLALSLGAIDPAVANELFDLLVEPRDGTANTLLLSLTPGGSSIALAVFDALARNRPAQLGETTALQVLSRTTPGDDGTLSDLRQRMIALASGGRINAEV